MADFVEPFEDAPQEPSSFGLFTTEHLQANYTYYSVKIEYVYHSGKVQSPVADDGDDSRTLKLHGEVMRKVVKWSCQRVGKPPDLPHPETTNENEELLSAVIRPEAPDPDNNLESLIYQVSGVYTYALKRPAWVAGGLFTGAIPCLTATPDRTVIGPEKFIQGII